MINNCNRHSRLHPISLGILAFLLELSCYVYQKLCLSLWMAWYSFNPFRRTWLCNNSVKIQTYGVASYLSFLSYESWLTKSGGGLRFFSVVPWFFNE